MLLPLLVCVPLSLQIPSKPGECGGRAGHSAGDRYDLQVPVGWIRSGVLYRAPVTNRRQIGSDPAGLGLIIEQHNIQRWTDRFAETSAEITACQSEVRYKNFN